MFLRFHQMKERKERGFTLIELLVVILIIAILAAIAIPVFLNQRKKGWTSQSESSLKNAATAAETFATDNNGSYDTMTKDDLTANGYNDTVNVVLTVVSADAAGYCLYANHDLSEDSDRWYDSDGGNPSETACT